MLTQDEILKDGEAVGYVDSTSKTQPFVEWFNSLPDDGAKIYTASPQFAERVKVLECQLSKVWDLIDRTRITNPVFGLNDQTVAMKFLKFYEDNIGKPPVRDESYLEHREYSAIAQLTAANEKLTEQLGAIQGIVDEIETHYKDGDKMKLMALVPLGKLIKLNQSLVTT